MDNFRRRSPFGALRSHDIPKVLLALWFSLAAPMAAKCAEPEPAIPAVAQAPNLENTDLAFSLLITVDLLRGEVGTAHAAWAQMRAQGADGFDSFTNVVQAPDGSNQKHVFNTFDELDRYVAEIARRQDAYAAEIRRRGFEELAPTYQTTMGSGCAKDWLTTGQSTIERTDFFFIVRQGERAFPGVVVKSSVVIIFPGGYQPPLVGAVEGGEMHLADSQKKCTMNLVATQ